MRPLLYLERSLLLKRPINERTASGGETVHLTPTAPERRSACLVKQRVVAGISMTDLRRLAVGRGGGSRTPSPVPPPSRTPQPDEGGLSFRLLLVATTGEAHLCLQAHYVVCRSHICLILRRARQGRRRVQQLQTTAPLLQPVYQRHSVQICRRPSTVTSRHQCQHRLHQPTN